MLSYEAGIVPLAGRELVAGLFWQVAENQSAALGLARQLAADNAIGADLLVIRPGNIVQYGLGCSSADHLAGQEAGAPLICDGVGPGLDFAAAFEVGIHPDGRRIFWLVVVHDGAIAPEGDKLIRGAEEARGRFAEILSSYPDGFSRLIAPDAWGVPNAIEASIASLVGDEKGPALRPAATIGSRLAGLLRNRSSNPSAPSAVPASKRRQTLLGLASLAAISWFAWDWWETERESAEVAEAFNRARSALPAAIQPTQVPVVAEIQPPWESLPFAGQRLAACREALNEIVHTVPGWSLAEMWCREKQVGVAWMRSGAPGMTGVALGGTVADFAVAASSWGQGYSIETGGDRIIVTGRVADLPPRGRQPGSDLQAVQRQVYSLFQAVNHKVVLNQPKPPVMLPGQKPDDVQRMPWREVDIEFSTALPPGDWSAALDGIPGISIDQYEWRASELAWKVRGRIHVRT